MKKSIFCEFCACKFSYKEHLICLALAHLRIECFPNTEFEEWEILEKTRALMASVNKYNVHLNLSYASTQLVDLEKSESEVKMV